MAGRGPAPKDPSKRARTNKPAIPPTRLAVKPSPQPALPKREHGWPAMTVKWWAAWKRAPQSARWTETDWLFALETAVVHAAFWMGDAKVAAELRQREEKMGGHPEARKRQGFFDAPDDEKPKDKPAATGARARRGPLVALPGGLASGQ